MARTKTKTENNNPVVRLFEYVTRHRGRITAQQGAEYTDSSFNDVRSYMASLKQEGYLNHAGNGSYAIPSPKTYRGHDPDLLAYIKYMKNHPLKNAKSHKQPEVQADPEPQAVPKTAARRRSKKVNAIGRLSTPEAE